MCIFLSKPICEFIVFNFINKLMTILKFNDLKKRESIHSNMDSEQINTIQINDYLILSKDKKDLFIAPNILVDILKYQKELRLLALKHL